MRYTLFTALIAGAALAAPVAYVDPARRTGVEGKHKTDVTVKDSVQGLNGNRSCVYHRGDGESGVGRVTDEQLKAIKRPGRVGIEQPRTKARGTNSTSPEDDADGPQAHDKRSTLDESGQWRGVFGEPRCSQVINRTEGTIGAANDTVRVLKHMDCDWCHSWNHLSGESPELRVCYRACRKYNKDLCLGRAVSRPFPPFTSHAHSKDPIPWYPGKPSKAEMEELDEALKEIEKAEHAVEGLGHVLGLNYTLKLDNATALARSRDNSTAMGRLRGKAVPLVNIHKRSPAPSPESHRPYPVLVGYTGKSRHENFPSKGLEDSSTPAGQDKHSPEAKKPKKPKKPKKDKKDKKDKKAEKDKKDKKDKKAEKDNEDEEDKKVKKPKYRDPYNPLRPPLIVHKPPKFEHISSGPEIWGPPQADKYRNWRTSFYPRVGQKLALRPYGKWGRVFINDTEPWVIEHSTYPRPFDHEKHGYKLDDNLGAIDEVGTPPRDMDHNFVKLPYDRRTRLKKHYVAFVRDRLDDWRHHINGRDHLTGKRDVVPPASGPDKGENCHYLCERQHWLADETQCVPVCRELASEDVADEESTRLRHERSRKIIHSSYKEAQTAAPQQPAPSPSPARNGTLERRWKLPPKGYWWDDCCEFILHGKPPSHPKPCLVAMKQELPPAGQRSDWAALEGPRAFRSLNCGEECSGPANRDTRTQCALSCMAFNDVLVRHGLDRPLGKPPKVRGGDTCYDGTADLPGRGCVGDRVMEVTGSWE